MSERNCITMKNVETNSLALAYLGDGLYELFIRTYLVEQGICKVNDLQKEAIKYVSAKAQSNFLESMFNEQFLSEEEETVVKRARNHKGSRHPKNTDIVTYKKSTGFEALIGYHYLNKNWTRIQDIMKFIVKGEIACIFMEEM